MPQDTGTPITPVTATDQANANNLNQAVGLVQQMLGTGSTALITALGAIATGITTSILGGVVGTSTNRLLRSKTVSSGSSAGSVQNSPVTCDDSGNLSGVGNITGVGNVIFATGKAVQTSTSAANTVLFQAYDVDGAAYVTFATLTANNTPTFDLAAAVTKGGVGIAILNTNTFAQQQGFGTATLTDAATIAWNLQTQQTAKVTLTDNRTLGAPTNMVDGYTYILRVIQDGTGSRTLAYNGVFKWPGGVAPTLSTAASAIDILTFLSDGTNMYGAIQKSFA